MTVFFPLSPILPIPFLSLLLPLSVSLCAPHEVPPVIYLDMREGKPLGDT